MPLNKKEILVIALLFTLVPFKQLKGQDFVIKKIAYSDFQGSRQVIEDRFGQIWSWANNTVYRITPHRAEQIGETTQYPWFKGVERLVFLEDKNSLIWILYGDQYRVEGVEGFQTNNLDIIDPVTRTITSAKNYFKERLPFDPTQVFNITRDKDGILWIGTATGQLYSYDGQFSFHFSLESKQVIGFVVPNAEKHFWMACENGLSEVDQNGKALNIYPLAGLRRKYAVSKDGSLRIADLTEKDSLNQVFVINDDAPLKVYEFPEFMRVDYTSKMWFHHDELWIANGRFFGFWEPQSGKIRDLTQLVKSAINDSGPDYQMYRDHNDQIWLNRGYEQFLIYNPQKRFGRKKGESTRGITRFNDSLLWVNSYSGPFLFNPVSGKTKKISINRDQHKFVNFTLFGMGVAKGKDHSIWLGAEDLVIYKYYPEKQEYEELNLPPDLGGVTMFPFFDSKDQFWVGLTDGLAYFSPENGRLQKFERFNGFDEFQDCFVQHIFENKEGLWLGTDKGVFLLKPGLGLVSRFNDFPFNYIVHIYQDRENTFWLSTRGGGLIRWNRENNEIKQILLGKIDKENQVHAVYEDGFGKLWMPTNNGLKRLDKYTNEVNTFYEENGIANNEFNFLSHYQDSDGTLYLGGVNGLTIFHPHDFKEESFSRSPLLLENVLLQEKNGTWKEQKVTESKTKLVIPYSTRALRFSFALLDFSAALPPNYLYQLEGYEEEWQNTTEGAVQFNRLPFGQYTLIIKGKGEHGEWSANTIKIPIQVLKPLYFQTWFILLVLLVLGLVGYGIALYRITNLKKNRRLLEAKVAERTKDLEELNQMKDRLFAILGHELRGPLVSFQNIAKSVSFLLKKKDYERVEEIGNVIETTTIHINDILDNLINWGLTQANRLPHHPEMLDLTALTEQVLELFEPLANSKNIGLNAKFDGNIQLWADRNAILTILRNLVNNSLKFTPSGRRVQVVVSGEKNTIKIAVEDTGLGMNQEQADRLLNGLNKSTQGTNGEKGTGMGVALCAALAKQNNGTIRIESALNRGTTVTVLFKQSIA